MYPDLGTLPTEEVSVVSPGIYTGISNISSLLQEKIFSIPDFPHGSIIVVDARLNLQSSYYGNTQLDLAAKLALQHLNAQIFPNSDALEQHIHPFRSYYGNDETVFESPGFEIPTVTLTRYPFDSYHTHLDQPQNLKQSALSECFESLIRTIYYLENNRTPTNVADGLYCLSNPKYDLYKKAPEIRGFFIDGLCVRSIS